MADLTITATSVVGDLTNSGVYLAGGTITAGQAVYVDANSKAQVLDANSMPATTPTRMGIALNGGAVNQPIVVQFGGTITIGAAVVAGTAYIVSATNPGGLIAPDADKASGWTVNELGRAINATQIALNPRIATAVV